MGDAVELKLEGVDELKDALRGLPDKIRMAAVRQALRDAGNVILPIARAAAPVLSKVGKGRKPDKRRKAGTLRRAIVVRTSKFARQSGDEGVFLGVRPLAGASRTKKLGRAGANNPNDPYYWWWQEFGWVPRGPGMKLGGSRRRQQTVREASQAAGGKVPGRRFLTQASQALDRATSTFMRSVVPAIEKLNAKAAAKAAKS